MEKWSLWSVTMENKMYDIVDELELPARQPVKFGNSSFSTSKGVQKGKNKL